MGFRYNAISGLLDLAGSSTPVVSAVYFGDPSTNGTWRIVVDGINLSFQYRESGSYVEKMAATP